ncbi:MAG: hypothetical protein K6B41_10350, partial [Butyrivibrio sp.]|nr:hypothetical protein [Butyrivibrio sp.]
MIIKDFYEKLAVLVNSGSNDEVIEKYLKDSINEADEEKNYTGYIAVCNELIGLYRSQKNFDNAYIACEDILTLMDSMGLSENVNFADALVTVAGVYRDAGRLSESQRYY